MTIQFQTGNWDISKPVTDNELLIEALGIAKDNYDFDGEYDKSEQIETYIKALENKND